MPLHFRVRVHEMRMKGKQNKHKTVNLLDHLNISCRLWGFVAILPLQDSPSVGVKLDGSDNDVARVDANGRSRPVRLVSLHTVNVDNPFLAVDLGDFSLTSLVFSPDNADLVILADGQ